MTMSGDGGSSTSVSASAVSDGTVSGLLAGISFLSRTGSELSSISMLSLGQSRGLEFKEGFQSAI